MVWPVNDGRDQEDRATGGIFERFEDVNWEAAYL